MKSLPQNQEKFKVFFFWYRFCSQIRMKTKKIGLYRILVVSSAGIWDLLELSAIFYRNVLDAFFQWGDAKSRWATRPPLKDSVLDIKMKSGGSRGQ